MSCPNVSVIVLNWNGKRFLEKCLTSLLDQSYNNYEVLLVDNGSTDDSVGFVQQHFGSERRLRILSLNENFGFSKGNNIGIKNALGNYVIILNNDTFVCRSFVEALVSVAESDLNMASVGCRILSMNGRTWFSQKFTNKGFVVPIFLQNLVRNRSDSISNTFCQNLANSGCACLFRKDVLDKIGGYDEDFMADCEDWDLGYRINLAGYKSVHLPSALVFHYGGGSAGYPPSRYARIFRNELFMYFKNYSSLNLIMRFPFFAFIVLPFSHMGFVVRQLSSNRGFKKDKGALYLFALLKAYSMFLSDLKIFTSKRYNIQKLRRITDDELFTETKTKFFV
jgi:GT2 family glycosyltransferase